VKREASIWLNFSQQSILKTSIIAAVLDPTRLKFGYFTHMIIIRHCHFTSWLKENQQNYASKSPAIAQKELLGFARLSCGKV
jgi:hypothetical protein